MTETFEESLTAYLAGQAGLSALVGSRVRFGYRPQRDKDLPCVTFEVASSQEQYSLTTWDGLTDVRVQLECWGSTVLEAKQVARELRALLRPDDVVGTLWGAYEVVDCALDDAGRDEDEAPEGGGDRPVHRVTMDAMITYREP